MPSYKERRLVPFTPAQMYGLIVDVKSYPEFLPWVKRAHVRAQQSDAFYADLAIGYKLLSLSYTSHITCLPDEQIKVHASEGPLKYLENTWQFRATADGQCEIEFHICFEFRSFLLKSVMENVFHEAVSLIVESFTARAKQIYG